MRQIDRRYAPDYGAPTCALLPTPMRPPTDADVRPTEYQPPWPALNARARWLNADVTTQRPRPLPRYAGPTSPDLPALAPLCCKAHFS